MTLEARCASCGAQWVVERAYSDPDGAIVGFVCTWRYLTYGRSFAEWSGGDVAEQN